MQAERDDEIGIFDLSCCVGGNLQFISYASFVRRRIVSGEQDFTCPIPNCILESPLPVLSPSEAKHIRPDFITGGS